MINLDILPAFLVFTIITCFSPGPNAMLAMTSGNLFGLRRTLPFILGAEFGFIAVLVAMVFGLDLLLARLPWLTMIVRILGALWLFRYGWKFLHPLFRSAGFSVVNEAIPQARPINFYEASLLQWVNPKGLIVASSSASSFLHISPHSTVRALLMGLVFAVLGITAFTAWALAGRSLSVLLKTGRFAKLTSAVMGIFLIVIAVSLLVL